MKNIFIVASCFAAITCFSACDDWTEVENVNINTPGIEEQDPAAYAKYLQNLVAYKNSDHKVVYAWFDNSEKTPFSRGQHISDAPDSLDKILNDHLGVAEGIPQCAETFLRSTEDHGRLYQVCLADGCHQVWQGQRVQWPEQSEWYLHGRAVHFHLWNHRKGDTP